MSAKPLELEMKKPRIVYERPPKVIVLPDSTDFKKVVQKLTGIPHKLRVHNVLQKNQGLSPVGILTSPENPFPNGFACTAPCVDPPAFPLQQNPASDVKELLSSGDFWCTFLDDYP